MSRIADNCLIEVTNLDPYPTIGVCDWSEIAHVAVTADPDWRALRDPAPVRVRPEPLVELSVLPLT